MQASDQPDLDDLLITDPNEISDLVSQQAEFIARHRIRFRRRKPPKRKRPRKLQYQWIIVDHRNRVIVESGPLGAELFPSRMDAQEIIDWYKLSGRPAKAILEIIAP